MISPMTIAEARDKCKSLVAKVPRDVLILSILVLASFLSFGLGYFAGLDAQMLTDTSNVQVTSAKAK